MEKWKCRISEKYIIYRTQIPPDNVVATYAVDRNLNTRSFTAFFVIGKDREYEISDPHGLGGMR